MIFAVIITFLSEKMTKEIGALTTTFYLNAWGLLFLLIILTSFSKYLPPQSNMGWVAMALNGVFNIGAWVFFFAGMQRIGATRASGMAFTLGAVPAMLVEGSKALYNVSKDELEALRQFVPDWSRNSTLIPMRDEKTGELKYIDFSHANAYDTLIRPLQSIVNAVQDGRTDEDQLGLTYEQLEDAMTNVNSDYRKKYMDIRKNNLHKMKPIPVCKMKDE